MDLKYQKLLAAPSDSIGEAEDRITELPDSILHHILSLLETKCASKTCVLSKRWNQIWTSIPSLAFSFWYISKPPSLSEINKFMDFVDRTLHLHDPSSNIQKFSISGNIWKSDMNINASRIHSWIENLTRRNVEELSLFLNLDRRFFIPLSLFTCASLTKLHLSVSPNIHFPKNITFPKLKVLQLCRVNFTDSSWNEQLFSNCLVLEELFMKNCTWFGMRKFCILTSVLKILEIENNVLKEDGLRDCELKIHAPILVSLSYLGRVAKDYDLSSFLTLDKAEVDFLDYESRMAQNIGCDAAACKFLGALSHVRCLLICKNAKVLPIVDNLPTFYNLNELSFPIRSATDKLIFAYLQAAPNLRRLEFTRRVLSSIDDEKAYDEDKDLFPHLQSVHFGAFSGETRELRWAELIFKNAKSLQTMSIAYNTLFSNMSMLKSKEVVMEELLSLPRASRKCVVKFSSNLL